MSSSTSACPPRLHLSIPPSTTSFKRSFEQFGFDLDSPTSGGEPGSSAGRSAVNTDRRDRNKRARSASSLSVESNSRSSRSSTANSGSSDETSASSSAEPDTFPVASSSGLTRSFLAPPRIPTPVIQDVDMPDYQEPSSPASEAEPQDHFHSTLARFSEFDSNISVLRSRSPSLTRSPTLPPVLPPLSLSEDTPIQVPDIEEPAVAFNYRDLLGSSTRLQHGSSTQSQASSSDLDYLAPDPGISEPPPFTLSDILDQDPPDLTFNTEPAVSNATSSFDIRTFFRDSTGPDNRRSPRLDALRPSSPLFRDMDDLRNVPPTDRPQRTPVHNDLRSWFDTLPEFTPREEPPMERFLPLPHPQPIPRDRYDGEPSDWASRLNRARPQQQRRSYSPIPVASYRRVSARSQTSRFGSSNSLMSENAAELERLHSHAAMLDRLEMDRLDNEFALDSEDDDIIPVLPQLPYERTSQRDSWPESFDRALQRRASLAFDRASQSRSESVLSRHLSLHRPHPPDPSPVRTPSSHTHSHSSSLERHVHSVDFFDSQSSTISDMARTIARNGRPEPTRMSSFHSMRSSRTFPTPPIIPPPDLGPGAIFIPHDMDNPARPGESAQPSPTTHHHSDFPELHIRPVSSQSRPRLSPTSSSLNPEAFAPGPFRNTMIWQAEMRQRRAAALSAASRAPSLPPLPFEEPEILDVQTESTTSRDSTRPPLDSHLRALRAMEHLREHQQRHRELLQSRTLRPTSSAHVARPSSSFGRGDESNPSSRQSSADIHNLLMNNHTRSQAPRVDDEDAAGFARTLGAITRNRISRLTEQREARAPTNIFGDEWGRLEEHERDLEREREMDRESGGGGGSGGRYVPRYAIPRRRASPQRGAVPTGLSGSRTNARYSRHQERFRPLYLDNAELFGGAGAPPRSRRRMGVFGFGLGDFMRDEDFDDSYESLIMLGSMLGEAVPKATPSEVISGLQTGLYKEWQTTDGDKRCPICLDDYAPTDTVTKLNDCPHWLHKECLEQWLKSANTCPVCRKAVKGASTSSATPTPAPRNRRQLFSRAPTHVHDLGNAGPNPHRRPGPEEDDEESTFGRRFYF